MTGYSLLRAWSCGETIDRGQTKTYCVSCNWAIVHMRQIAIPLPLVSASRLRQARDDRLRGFAAVPEGGKLPC